MKLAVIVPFLNEEGYLEASLGSLSRQTREPDRLLLVDDGSTDTSPEAAREFARNHGYARALSRPRREPSRDRLAEAAELVAFTWAVDQLDIDWDVVCKLDADLELTSEFFANIEEQLHGDPRLGIAGAYLSIQTDAGPKRERCPPDHVRGATKFYRRECFQDVFPLPVSLGWDTIDEVKARMHGWRTASFSLPGGDPVHLRPTATHDGALRGLYRAGRGTYAYGAHPLWVIVSGLRRIHAFPPLLGAMTFFSGWFVAALKRAPRASKEVRAFGHREQLERLRGLVRTAVGRGA
jgi:biofilm PGA synthesis N-glycosyltransferase PgaC